MTKLLLSSPVSSSAVLCLVCYGVSSRMRMKSFVIASLPGLPHYARVWGARTKATVTIFIPTMHEHSRGPGVVILFPCIHIQCQCTVGVR